jgi:tRNA(Ile)-lysidine synthase
MMTLPDEIRLRILARLIAVIGGSDEPVPLSGLEAMTEGRNWQSPAGQSLAGAVFRSDKDQDRILAFREFGRKSAPLPAVTLKSGQRCLWDRRFTVANDTQPATELSVRALGPDGAALVKAVLKQAGQSVPAPVPAALYTIPSFWDGGRLAAVPLLKYFDPAAPPCRVECVFSALTARETGFRQHP